MPDTTSPRTRRQRGRDAAPDPSAAIHRSDPTAGPPAAAPTAARGRTSANAESAPGRRAIAVILSRFPLLTETFILREVDELERQGQPVCLVSLGREHPGIVHREAEAWLPRALFTAPVTRAILAANARVPLRRPARYALLLCRMMLTATLRPRAVRRSLALLLKSVYLAERLEREGIRHVHAHYATHPATAAMIISSLAPIGFSFTVHARDLFLGWRRPLLAAKVRHARFIRVTSTFGQSFLRALHPEHAGKIRVIHAGIDPDAYRRPTAGATNAAADGADAGGAPLLLCVASLEAYRGVPVLIESCARLNEAGFDFACDIVGEGGLRTSLEDQIARAGLGDRVQLRGALRQDEVAARLQQATIVVLPGDVAPHGPMEGVPVALMEAMAAERPVVASAISAIPELVEHGVTGLLVAPGSAGALTDAIAVLLLNPARAREMGRRGRRKVLREFRLDRCATALLTELDRWNPPVRDDGMGR